MNFKEILELIDKVADRGIVAVEVERAGTRIRIEGKSSPSQIFHAAPTDPRGVASAHQTTTPESQQPTSQGAAPPAAPPPSEDEGLHIITSPIVGTFYRSPNPESEMFVNPGDRVSKGKVLCIIEAMKLMNEIECDVDGVLTKIYPQNGQPIEYGEKLFAVKLQ